MKCPECGKEVSSQATACPHCGCPVAVTLKDSAPPSEPQSAGALPMPTPGAAPAQPPAGMPQEQKQGSKALGCLGIIVVVVLIAWIADLSGCNKPQESEAERSMKNAAGPGNPIAQKVQTLSAGNAYSVGYQDGILEFANMAQKFSQMQGDMLEQLNNLREGKNAFFDLMATQNKFDQTVFSEYRRGWNAGWNNHGLSH
jgi:hypothetical protein